MSTFAGNRKPTWLEPQKVEQGAVWFHAPRLELLTLSVALVSSDQLEINVYHYGKHHVRIVLRRDTSGIFLLKEAQGKNRSCLGHPD